MEFVSRMRPLPPGTASIPGVDEWIQALLYSRGISDGKETEQFLHPAPEQLLDPMSLPGMRDFRDTAEKCLKEKGRNLRVTVYGDYDVDGICASVIMERAFTLRGAKVQVRIPDRHEEGYGLNMAAVEELKDSTDLLVTVDCGITSLAETARAKEMGMRVLVTDHHTPLDTLPDADAVVDPMLDKTGYSPLCGAGVALKALWALCGREAAEEMLDICALATVADLVPLTGENRVLVFLGLRRINASPRPGIRALIRSARLREGPDAITSERIAFQLAPRLNAAGRLSSAKIAYHLLTSGDEETAAPLAEQLEKLNQERRKQEEEAFAQALEQAETLPLKTMRGIVVFHPDWDTGVIGLVAGKLAERYAYPTVCLTVNRGGECQGSGRSACGIDLYEALKTCGKYLTRFGGHRQAAGLALKKEDLPAFTEAFSDAVARQLGESDLKNAAEYDLEMSLQDVDLDHIGSIASLEPFGMGNPRPVFRFDACQMETRAVGAGGRHLKCVFYQGGVSRQGMWFSHGHLAGDTRPSVDLLAEMCMNEFQGRVTPEVAVRGIRLDPGGLRDDPAAMREDCLRDLMTVEMLGPLSGAPACEEKAWQDTAPPRRGFLYLCRSGLTAAAVAAAYPDIEMVSGTEYDRRAYSAVALGMPIEQIPPFYDAVVLCDGSFGEAEIKALNRQCPGVRIIVSPSTLAGRLRRSLLLSREKMREMYLCFRAGDHLEARDVCERCGLDMPGVIWGAAAMERVGLARITQTPFGVRLLPRPQGPTDPTATAWYHLTETGDWQGSSTDRE